MRPRDWLNDRLSIGCRQLRILTRLTNWSLTKLLCDQSVIGAAEIAALCRFSL
jgi:hypothetical protein